MSAEYDDRQGYYVPPEVGYEVFQVSLDLIISEFEEITDMDRDIIQKSIDYEKKKRKK